MIDDKYGTRRAMGLLREVVDDLGSGSLNLGAESAAACHAASGLRGVVIVAVGCGGVLDPELELRQLIGSNIYRR